MRGLKLWFSNKVDKIVEFNAPDVTGNVLKNPNLIKLNPDLLMIPKVRNYSYAFWCKPTIDLIIFKGPNQHSAYEQ